MPRCHLDPFPAFRTVAACFFAVLLAGCVEADIRPAPNASPKAVQINEVPPGATPEPGDWTVLRLNGPLPDDRELRVREGVTKSGDPAPYYTAGTAKLSGVLAEDYARPTPPGALELKVYEPYRQAVWQGRRSQNGAFMPLFRHISRRNIAMTVPVVMEGSMAGDDADAGSMAFLYRTPDLGPVGDAEEGVVVEDTVPTTVVSVGVQGARWGDRLAEAETVLQAWVDKQAERSKADGRWVADGGLRLLVYNGPDTPRDRTWWELQRPLRWDKAVSETGETNDE